MGIGRLVAGIAVMSLALEPVYADSIQQQAPSAVAQETSKVLLPEIGTGDRIAVGNMQQTADSLVDLCQLAYFDEDVVCQHSPEYWKITGKYPGEERPEKGTGRYWLLFDSMRQLVEKSIYEAANGMSKESGKGMVVMEKATFEKTFDSNDPRFRPIYDQGLDSFDITQAVSDSIDAYIQKMDNSRGTNEYDVAKDLREGRKPLITRIVNGIIHSE